MNENKEQLNLFLVKIFNDILRLEEASLAKGEFNNLSISEIHVIEAVYDSCQDNTNTMTEIANKLMVTSSTLTTSVKTLEQKGYLIRTKFPTDKRRVYVTLTPLAEKAYKAHRQFHNDLVDNVTETLSDEESTTLALALSTLHRYFISIK
jgi:DNA-binding MarR family transcriptional regulator